MQDEYFTVAQVAEYLHVDENTIYKKRKFGEIPYIKESGLGYRFPKSEIDKWLKEITFKPSTPTEQLPVKKQKLDISVEEYLQGNLKGGNNALAQKKGRWNLGRKGVYRRRLNKGYSWCYWYYDEHGKRKRVTIPEATCLEDAIIEMEARVKKVFNKKHGIKNQSITFKEFAPIYLEKYSKPIKDSGDTDKKFIEGRLIPHFGDMLLTEMTPEHVSDFIAKFKPKVDYLEEVKGSTINKHLQVLSGMYNLAEEFGYEVGKNPVRRKIHFADESEYRRTRVLDYEEESPLMREAATHLKPIIQCAILQLMRSQEILQLMVADVDLEYCTITIRPENNKTGKLDIIPLRAEMKVILMNLIEENEGRTPFVFNYYDPRYGGKYRPVKGIQHAFQAACRRAGIEGLQFRDLRRTGATRLHEAGVDPLIVQRLLRHSSFKISEEVYIQSNLKMMKEALNRADEKASKEIDKPSVLTHHWHTKEADKKETPAIPLFSMN